MKIHWDTCIVFCPQEYLKKYWYMGTNNPDPRIAALSDEDGFEVGLMSFQGMHGLNQTGEHPLN